MTQSLITSPGRLLILLVFLLFSPSHKSFGDEFRPARERLIREIEQDVIDTSSFLNKSRLDPMVLRALGKVKRHEFVPDNYKKSAYLNRPLPIGYGQTISQPYIVAIMTDLLELEKTEKVLEIGTGSGYQAAVLAEMAGEVYTIEIIEELFKEAKERLSRLGYHNIQVRRGDGYYGWKEKGPFDGIMVTAAAGSIPPPLIDQLKAGGKMLIPVGGAFATQYLILIEKDHKDNITTRQLLPVRFVPLTGKR